MGISVQNEKYDFQCSICQLFFINPVVLACKHFFCEECIQKWQSAQIGGSHSPTCPVCRKQFSKGVKDAAKAKAVSDYVQRRFEMSVEECNKREREPNNPSLSDILNQINANKLEAAMQMAGNLLSDQEKENAYRAIAKGCIKNKNLSVFNQIAEKISVRTRYEICANMANILIENGQLCEAEDIADKIPRSCSYQEEIYVQLIRVMINKYFSPISNSPSLSDAPISTSSAISQTYSSTSTTGNVNLRDKLLLLKRLAVKISSKNSELLSKVAYLFIKYDALLFAHDISLMIKDKPLHDEIEILLAKKFLENKPGHFDPIFYFSSRPSSSPSSSSYAKHLLEENSRLCQPLQYHGSNFPERYGASDEDNSILLANDMAKTIFNPEARDKYFLKIITRLFGRYFNANSEKLKKDYLNNIQNILMQITNPVSKKMLQQSFFVNLLEAKEYSSAKELLRVLPDDYLKELLDEKTSHCLTLKRLISKTKSCSLKIFSQMKPLLTKDSLALVSAVSISYFNIPLGISLISFYFLGKIAKNHAKA